MYHKISLAISLSLSFLFSFSQQLNSSLKGNKNQITTAVFGEWPTLESPILTTNGQFAMFIIKNSPVASKTYVLRSLYRKWEMDFIGARSGVFTANDQKALFLTAKDSLCIINLATQHIDYLSGVSSFKLIKQGDNEWLAYQLRGKDKQLVIRNVATSTEHSFKNVLNYLFSSNANVLLLHSEVKDQGGTSTRKLSWISFPLCESRDIWQGAGASGFVFDKQEGQLAFTVSDIEGNSQIWFYKSSASEAILLADDKLVNMDSNLALKGTSFRGFTNDGLRLFIELKEKPYIKPKTDAVMSDVWSHHDVKLQSRQLEELNDGPKRFAAMINLQRHQILRLQQNEDANIFFIPNSDKFVVNSVVGSNSEKAWNSTVAENNGQSLVYQDGTRKKLLIDVDFNATSPSGRYLIGKNESDSNNLYAYDLMSGQYHNLTKNIPGGIDDKYESNEPSLRLGKVLQFAAWVEDEKDVLIYDNNDIWLVDPQSEKQPICITNQFGYRKEFIFKLPDAYRGRLVSTTRKLLIHSFNQNNKEEGFAEVQPGRANDPKLLLSGPYRYKLTKNDYNLSQIKKDRNRNVLVSRENVSYSCNYFLTSDFKSFLPVTDVYPEASYNWIKADLHSWKSTDGRVLQGVLYKPDNFDSTKKYPVIYHFYQNKSDEINKYQIPDATGDEINIPWFVSNGYLVFTPDIYFKKGLTGESAENSIVSAAQYLTKFRWVDAEHMGIQGHSFGSYHTNYIITHSNLFAAAMSSSGVSDLISAYGSLGWGSVSAQGYFEGGQGRMNSTLWESSDLYIEGSPVLLANKVSTPLLMMSNKKDQFNYNQGMEFFTALRRLGKSVWMLQYDNGDHILSEKNDMLQHTIRLTQFFNHYLKSAPAPIWMSQGIPAKLKGIQTGYTLNPTGNCGSKQNPCKICTSWNTKMKSNPTATLQEIEQKKITEHWQ